MLVRWLFILSLFSSRSRAGSPIIIDDERGDSVSGKKLEYWPSVEWRQGATCQTCLVHLDPSFAFDGTWHNATTYPQDEPLTITASYNGSSVYVYNILASYIYSGKRAITNLRFELDGEIVGTYFNDKIQGTTYNVAVYPNDSVPFGSHTLVIRLLPDPLGVKASVALLDYIHYSVDEPRASPPAVSSPSSFTTPPSESSLPSPPALTPKGSDPPPTEHSDRASESRPPVGALVGGIVGGIAAIGVALAVYLVRRRQRARASGARTFTIDPPVEENVLQAEVVELREQVMRIQQQLVEAPPSYHSEPNAITQTTEVSPLCAGGKGALGSVVVE